VTTTYRIFGIPVWSVTVTAPELDKEALYKEFADRFGKEMITELKAKGVIR